MELFDFEDVAEDRPRSSLTYEERLEAAARRRLEGNDHFRAARFGDALARCVPRQFAERISVMHASQHHCISCEEVTRKPIVLVPCSHPQKMLCQTAQRLHWLFLGAFSVLSSVLCLVKPTLLTCVG